MKLYTRRGDQGKTSLFDGSEVRKDDLRVAAYGTVDEVNAWLGLIAATAKERPPLDREAGFHAMISTIQCELFNIGADLATPVEATQRDYVPAVGAEEIQRLESWIDAACEPVSPLTTFVVPGGCAVASQLHVGRTVCRRAERHVVTLAGQAAVNPRIVIYLNRLSDLLFAWSRWANHVAGVPDVAWVNPRRAR
ncbi:MAG: cob(I)yrinic acid a,c-diamide adenosyltransferase [Nitrospira sp.]|nr:MAG: cob(I)yrinic acid a,c-diamide adenosyltransferase [Nitrospira sp.]